MADFVPINYGRRKMNTNQPINYVYPTVCLPYLPPHKAGGQIHANQGQGCIVQLFSPLLQRASGRWVVFLVEM